MPGMLRFYLEINLFKNNDIGLTFQVRYKSDITIEALLEMILSCSSLIEVINSCLNYTIASE